MIALDGKMRSILAKNKSNTAEYPTSIYLFWDARLAVRYGVNEEMWNHFSREILEAVEVSGPPWAWRMHKRNVIKRV
jgi:hypothetical protein